MNKKIFFLERLYLLLTITIALVIIFTPLIITGGLPLIPEEVLEVLCISVLSGIGLLLFKLYRNEVKKNLDTCDVLTNENNNLEMHLMDAVKHIGSVNVQIDEVRNAFSEIKKYPETKKEFKSFLQFFGARVLCMTDAGWVHFRIIDSETSATLGEYCEARGDAAATKPKIGNKQLLDNRPIPGCNIIKSTPENFSLKTFCIIQTAELNRDQEVLITAIVNQLEMVYLIYASNYSNKTAEGNSSAAGALYKVSSI